MTFLCNTTTKNSQTIHSNKITHFGSLPNTGLIDRAVEFDSFPTINSINYPERPCLYTSFPGSITVEAAICFPIFIFVTLSLVYLINIMYLQTTLQIALEETVRNSNKIAYVTSSFYSLNDNDKKNVLSTNSSISENIGASLITTAYFHNLFLTDELTSILDNSCIKNGSKGISFLSSSLDISSGIADIILHYTVTIPFLPEKLFSLKLSNRCYVHLYTGKDLDEQQEKADEYVYYTVYGNVFHFNRYCKYLINYSEAVRYLDMKGSSSSCAMCKKTIEELREENPIVYIMPQGKRFHTTLKCAAFTGHVFRINYSSLKDNHKICEECLKGK